jgi:hypothetical protein
LGDPVIPRAAADLLIVASLVMLPATLLAIAADAGLRVVRMCGGTHWPTWSCRLYRDGADWGHGIPENALVVYPLGIAITWPSR